MSTMEKLNNPRELSHIVTTMCLLLAVFVLFALAVTKIDIAEVYITENGLAESGESASIGFSKINIAIAKLLGFNEFFYGFSSVFAILSFGLIGLFGFVGLIQWIKRKNILKVDYEILALGVYYLIILGTYFAFTKFSINVRPVITDAAEGLEYSFPSSHTIMCVSVMVTAPYHLKRLAKTPVTVALTENSKILCTVFLILGVISRFLSGVHWFTDIIGGLILSAFMLSLYRLLLYLFKFLDKDK